jgi:hypothetical protein
VGAGVVPEVIGKDGPAGVAGLTDGSVRLVDVPGSDDAQRLGLIVLQADKAVGRPTAGPLNLGEPAPLRTDELGLDSRRGQEVATALRGRDGERLGLGGGFDAVILD